MPTGAANSDNQGASLKLKTARTLKWNSIDKISSQVLYAVVGIVLANVLSQEDFGLAGVIYVFQAFAILFVDSGFGAALLQAKRPEEKDYSTVFWFNLAVSVIIYALLFMCAPLIASIFHDERLVALSRVMFLTFILNGLGIIQTNRLMKSMNVKMIAISNLLGLVFSGTAGIWLALNGYGAWALVWQSIILAGIKTGWLWITGKWLPSAGFHVSSLKKIVKVGSGVFSSSFLNTLFQYIYSFVIGMYSLVSLGIYTQADKWSKMGSASLSQILTASFVPLLSQFQDNESQYRQMVSKINGFTAFILFPFMGGLIVMAEPIFHLLFGHKWDAAIVLFQILILRGIFVVLISLYNNYILALGHAKSMVMIEVVKDVLTVAALLATVFLQSVEALVWGQLASSVLAYFFVLRLTSRKTGCLMRTMLSDMLPYAALSTAAMAIMALIARFINTPLLLIAVQGAAGMGLYYSVLKFTGSTILKESTGYIFGRFHRKKTQ